MKRFKFEMGGSYTFYWGFNLGEALTKFIKDWPNRIEQIESITEEPLKEYEIP